MKLERTQNAKRNIGFGMINQLVAIGAPFVIRTIAIQTLGTQYLGLNSLFTSILMVLSLTEMGVSSAIVFSMYKPIAEDDEETICALLNFYKVTYRIIGLIVFIAGIAIIPFLPRLIKGTYPQDINLVTLYLIYLFNTGISYFLFAYYGSLLSAFQRNDIISKINTALQLLRYVAQGTILICFRNYYLYVLVLPVITISTNVFSAIAAYHIYPQYTCRGKISEQLKADIKIKVSGMLISKLQNISRNSFDNIFISAFLGLTVAAIYSNYYYIMSSVMGVLYIFTASIRAGVGNAIATESVDKNYQDMNKINFAFMWISGWCTICLLCLYQPFMELWMGKNMLLEFSAMILFCIYFYVLRIGDIRYVYYEANGLWWENRYFAILESIGNLVLNYLLGRYWGIYGILMATILTILIINFGGGSLIVFKYYFGIEKLKEYYLSNIVYAMATILVGTITFYCCKLNIGGNIFSFLIKCAICVIVPNMLYAILYYRNKEFKISVPWMLRTFSLDKYPMVATFVERIER